MAGGQIQDVFSSPPFTQLVASRVRPDGPDAEVAQLGRITLSGVCVSALEITPRVSLRWQGGKVNIGEQGETAKF